jgi:endonuclease G, mitochondrial
MSTTGLWRSPFGRHSVAAAAAVFSPMMLGSGASWPTESEAMPSMEDKAQSQASSSSQEGLSPTPPIYIFRPNPNLEIAFDTRTRNPLYVLEHITPGSRAGSRHSNNNAVKLKRPNFYEEKSLPEEFRSRVSHYRNSGFDRGHLAAAANYMHTTQQEVNDTFNLINISPQDHSMNCSIWAQLERWVQKVCEENERSQQDTYIVSGPLWMPVKQIGDKLFEYRYSAIGNPPSLVSVPTHFYKIVVATERKSCQIVKFACFVIPNQDVIQGTARRVLLDFLVPWTAIEAVTGLHFFPRLAKGLEWKEMANRLTNEIIKASGRSQTLLLTDGSASTGVSKGWRFNGRGKRHALSHFCADGSCS